VNHAQLVADPDYTPAKGNYHAQRHQSLFRDRIFFILCSHNYAILLTEADEPLSENIVPVLASHLIANLTPASRYPIQ
jgi:hypothetical protein